MRSEAATRGHVHTARAGQEIAPTDRRVEPRSFLADFGLAKSVATGSKLTRTGVALGTPAYMSPEQARGDVSSLTPGSDVFGLGCVLYEMLAGRPPFPGETPAAVVGRVLLEEPPRLRSRRPDAPKGLELVVGAALRKRPDSRYADGGALRDDLERVLGGERPRARPPLADRGRGLAALAAAAAALAIAVAATRPGRPAPPSVGVATPVGGAGVAGPEAGPAALATRAQARAASDPREAARLLGEALAADPLRGDWRLRRGLLLWGLAENEEARGEWDRVPAGSPEAPAARLYRGLEVYFGKPGPGSEAPEAVAILEPVARSGGREAALARGAMAAFGRDFRAAREILRGLPGWEGALLRGFVEGGDPAGDRELAVREYSRALDEGMAFAWVHHDRGVLRDGLGDRAGALADFERCLELAPRLPEALVSRAIVRIGLGDLGAAIADCDAALRERPGFPAACNTRATARLRAKDYPGAEADATEALRLDPGYVEARITRANTRLFLGDASGAVEDASEAIRRRPDAATAWLRRGNARELERDPTGAAADYSEALRRDPALAEALAARGRVRAVLGETREALGDLTLALRLQPDLFHAHLSRANVRDELGDAEGALEDYREELRLRPDDPDALGNLGVVLKNRGDPREAAETFRRFLSVAPAHEKEPQVRAWLAECEARVRALEGR
ncbi:MAG: tetratricopeptide repeat protein [Planctomycetales bacterium]|nr:tetratricopeptide repeat protein [Planctomycetales bacterium]